jgi:hypothetical protein
LQSRRRGGGGTAAAAAARWRRDPRLAPRIGGTVAPARPAPRAALTGPLPEIQLPWATPNSFCWFVRANISQNNPFGCSSQTPCCRLLYVLLLLNLRFNCILKANKTAKQNTTFAR